VHWHAIDVLEGVTLLEFKPNLEEQPSEQEVQAPEGATEGDVVNCLDHTPCNFMKGKPRSIISLLLSINANTYYVIYIVALSFRCWMKTLVALISNPCPDIITMNSI
jgi:hypothetical protein